MWKFSIYISLTIIIIGNFTSCKIEKRHYTKGFHIESRWFNKVASDFKEPKAETGNESFQVEDVMINKDVATENTKIEKTEETNPEVSLTYNEKKEKNKLPLNSKLEIEKTDETIHNFSDTLKKPEISYNEKVVADGEETLYEAIGSMIALTIFLLLGFLFVLNPTIGMFWLAATFLLPCTIALIFTSLYFGIKALIFLKRGWIPKKNKKTFVGWLFLLLLNIIMMTVLISLLIAMFV